MKVSPADLKTLSDAIAPLDDAETRERYRHGDFPRADAVQDLDKRYRWDLFWSAFNTPNMDVRRVLASGEYDDSHIYTALRKIVPTLSAL